MKTTRIDYSRWAKWAIGCLMLFFWVHVADAAFSLSGTTITQSGTDTNLSGLQSVAGVTYTTIGEHTTYYTDSLNLVVTGELTIDPTYEKLVFGGNTPTPNVKVSGGTLNLGIKSTINGKIIYTYGTALEFLKTNPGGSWEPHIYGGFYLENGATFNAYGAKIKSRLPVGWGSINLLQELYGDVEKLELDMPDPLKAQIRFDIQPGFESGVKLYNGFEVTSQATSPTQEIVFSGTYSENFSPTLKNAMLVSTNTQQYPLVFRNLVVGDNAGQYDIKASYTNSASNPYIDFYNLDVGTSASVLNSYNPFVFSFYKDVNVEVRDTDTNTIQDVRVYIENTNGDVFSGVTNASGTLDDDITVLYAKVVEGSPATMWRRYTKGNSASDYNNNENDVLDVQFASYNHLLSQLEISMKETGTLEVSNLLFTDPTITETDKAVVDAYTEIETANKFYDRAKAYLYDNYTGETATLVARTGDTVDAGGYNIVIDPDVSPAFAFDGSTITIKSSNFDGNLMTTGVITIQGGAAVDGGIGDANGDSSVTTEGASTGAVTTVYASDAATVLQSGSENITYQYTSTDPNDYIFIESVVPNGDTIRIRHQLEEGFFTVSLGYGESGFTAEDRDLLEENNALLSDIWDRIALWPDRLLSYFDVVPFLR